MASTIRQKLSDNPCYTLLVAYSLIYFWYELPYVSRWSLSCSCFIIFYNYLDLFYYLLHGFYRFTGTLFFLCFIHILFCYKIFQLNSFTHHWSIIYMAGQRRVSAVEQWKRMDRTTAAMGAEAKAASAVCPRAVRPRTGSVRSPPRSLLGELALLQHYTLHYTLLQYVLLHDWWQ